VPLQRLRGFAKLGWEEFSLPDLTRYFSNPNLRIVTDLDLRKNERLDSITTFLEAQDTQVPPPPEWELWLHEVDGSTTAFTPLKAWIHHGSRKLSHHFPSQQPNEIIDQADNDNIGKLPRIQLTQCLR
jgi:hypothetical protein